MGDEYLYKSVIYITKGTDYAEKNIQLNDWTISFGNEKETMNRLKLFIPLENTLWLATGLFRILRTRGLIPRVSFLTGFILSIFFSITLFANFAWAGETLRLATTTSTYETGLLDHIFAPFEKKYDVKIHIISVGTGKAIKLGENGDVDVILVHAKEAEDKFVNDGFGVNRRDVMYNDFVILGPQEDPAKIAGLTGAKEAFKHVYTSKQTFISRGDDSGTHKKEKDLWLKTGINPGGSLYLETGQGMNAALRIADEKNAYVMLDRATYLFNKDKIRLKKLVEGDPDLFNSYGIISVSPYKYSHVKYELAMALTAWITSPVCQEMIKNYKKDGYQLYHPSADK